MSGEVLTFTGVTDPIKLYGQNTLGTTPDVYALQFTPQLTDIPNAGVSTLVFGNSAGTITLTNCHIDRVQYARSEGGYICTAYIWDRRWRWQSKVITGRYNVRGPDGTIVAATEKTPQELASLLLAAIGETASVTMLPNGDRPEVSWDNANAADELYDLLRQRGCAIGIPDDTTTIYELGGGSAAPSNTDVMSVQQSVDPPELPETIRLICDSSIVQSKLKLIAVGIETDGSIVELDDLSYKPAGGWESVSNWLEFPEITDEDARQLAIQSVGRLYKVDSQADGGQAIDGTIVTTNDASELLPLSTKLLDVYTDLNGKQQAARAYLEGTYAVESAPANELTNTPPFTRYRGGWKLYGDTGLVELSDPAIHLNVSEQWTAAELYLVCSYSVLNPSTGQYYREQFDRSLGGIGTVAIHTEDLFRTIRQEYDYTDPTLVDTTHDNMTALTTNAEAVLDAIEARYVQQTGYVVLYRHIQEIFANGKIFQVGYRAGTGGFFTIANVATESLVSTPREVDRFRKRVSRANEDYGTRSVRRRRRREGAHWRD